MNTRKLSVHIGLRAHCTDAVIAGLTKRTCNNEECGKEYRKEYMADRRNLSRGWGLTCFKSCAVKGPSGPKIEQKKQTMEKKDIKTGMRVQQRDGSIKIILLNTSNGDILTNEEATGHLDNYDKNLLHRSMEKLDIMKVFEYPLSTEVLDLEKLTKVIWERDSIEELTMEQVCRELGREIRIKK